MQVHRELGPGLLESVYRVCLEHELRCRGIPFEGEVPVPVCYRGMKLDLGYRVDLLVATELVVELKAVVALVPLHTAQLLTYLKLLRRPVGLLINFNTPLLRQGIRRVLLSSQGRLQDRGDSRR